MNKIVLITGGCGFIGSHICVELLNNNYSVIIIDSCINSDETVVKNIEKITNKNIIFYKFDLLDKMKIENVFTNHKIHYVIHCAGLKSVAQSTKLPIYYYKNNIATTLNLIEVMTQFNCLNLIFSSSATVYGTSKPPLLESSKIGEGITNPYGQTKFMIEKILLDLSKANSNFKISVLRYFNPVGAHSSGLIGENPNDIPNNLMPYILKVAIQNNTNNFIGPRFDNLSIFGSDYPTRDGTCIRDYIHVVDLAKGHIKSLKNLKKGINHYNLGTGNGISVLEIVNKFIQVNNVKLPYQLAQRRAGDLPELYCNPEKALKELKWKTTLNLEDMCKDAWNFQKKTI